MTIQDRGMKLLTIDLINSWNPCYKAEKVLPIDWSGTILDLLDKKEIPFKDRLWAIMRTELVSEKLMRLFAVWCARQVQHLMNDERSLKALDVAEKFANGLVSSEKLDAARAAARDAAWDAARAAAWAAARAAARDAAWDAARDAARDAAWDAARDAARAAARDAAWDAARAAARDAARAAAWAAQENKLREMILAGIESGDVF